MKKKIIISLVVLVVLVLAYILIMYNPFSNNDTSTVTPSNIPVFSASKDDIIGIDVNMNGEFYSLVKNNGVWSFFEEEGVYAIQPKVDGIAYDLSNLYATSLVAENVSDFKMYGLEPAYSTVVVHLADGTINTFLVGNKVPDGNGYYFKSDVGNNVYVIDNGKAMVLTYTRRDLISMTMQELYKGDIDEITVTRNNGKSFTVKQNLESKTEDWIIKEPFLWDADDDVIQSKLLNFIVGIFALEYEENKTDSEMGLTNPRITVSVLKTDGTKQNFYVGKTDENIAYVRVDGVKYAGKVDGEIVKLYNVEPFDIMNKLVQSADYHAITNVVLDGDLDINLKYAGKNSMLNGKSLSEEMAIRLYSAICNLKVDAEAKNQVSGKTVLSAEFDYGTFSYEYKLIEYDARNYALTHDGKKYFLVRKDNYDAWKMALEILM